MQQRKYKLSYREIKDIENRLKDGELPQDLAKEYNVFVIGGGMMYKSMLPYVDEAIATAISNAIEEIKYLFDK